MSLRDLTARELQQYLEYAAPGIVLLDVREPWEYAIGHLARSRLLPMRTIPSALETLDPQQETVLICHHGIRSYQVALYLARQGFTQLINLQGGVAAWARDVDSNMPTY